MQRLKLPALIGSLLGLIPGCSATQGKIASVKCGNPGSPVAAQTRSSMWLAENIPTGVTGIQTLRGYLDIEYIENGQPLTKRCVTKLLPDMANVRQIKVVTAGHCLPTLSKISKDAVKLKVHVFFQNGFIPLSIDAPNLRKFANTGSFLEENVVARLPKMTQLGTWLPEYATRNCVKWTTDFKLGSKEGHKTVCFSRQDMRILDAKIDEANPKWLELYENALSEPLGINGLTLSELNREKGLSLGETSPTLSLGLLALWRAHNVDDMRKRNHRALAYLANVQYCMPGVTTVDPIFNQPDTKLFCEMKQGQPEKLDQFLKASTSDLEYSRLQEIINDLVTPVQQLRDRYLGCNRTPDSRPDEFTACEIGVKAQIFFDQWVRDARANFDALSSTDKRGLTFANYFRIVAPNKSDET